MKKNFGAQSEIEGWVDITDGWDGITQGGTGDLDITDSDIQGWDG